MSEMKLNEAMRLGAMLKPQLRGRSFDGAKTCAIAAACDAAGLLIRFTDVSAIARKQWPILSVMAPVPAGPALGQIADVQTIVIYLNDGEPYWTREQISKWVEGIERAHDPVTATEDQPAVEPAVELGALAQKGI